MNSTDIKNNPFSLDIIQRLCRVSDSEQKSDAGLSSTSTQFHSNGFRFNNEDADSDLQHRYCIVHGDEDGQYVTIGEKSG